MAHNTNDYKIGTHHLVIDIGKACLSPLYSRKLQYIIFVKHVYLPEGSRDMTAQICLLNWHLSSLRRSILKCLTSFMGIKKQ